MSYSPKEINLQKENRKINHRSNIVEIKIIHFHHTLARLYTRRLKHILMLQMILRHQRTIPT